MKMKQQTSSPSDGPFTPFLNAVTEKKGFDREASVFGIRLKALMLGGNQHTMTYSSSQIPIAAPPDCGLKNKFMHHVIISSDMKSLLSPKTAFIETQPNMEFKG